jgi:Tfp pilus assembly protein PilZ
MTLVPSVVVRVKFVNRRQLKLAFMRDLSKGTLFVRTDSPLPIGEGVLCVLELPGGDSVEITGEVESIAGPPDAGMTVRLSDFTADKIGKIEELLSRARTLLPVGPPPTPAMEMLVRGLRRLLWLCGEAVALGEVDYYQILGLPATASTDEIREACSVLRVFLDPASPPDGLADRLTSAQHARVAALHRAIAKIERTLTDAKRRAEYDAEVFSIVR